MYFWDLIIFRVFLVDLDDDDARVLCIQHFFKRVTLLFHRVSGQEKFDVFQVRFVSADPNEPNVNEDHNHHQVELDAR
jgi:hypothetical protein